jgi:cytochrome c6
VATNSKSSWPDKHSATSIIPVAAAPVTIASLATFGVILSFPFLALPTAALAANNDIERGSTLFSANCAGCHAGGLNFVQENKTLKKEALAKFATGGSPDDLSQVKVQEWVMKSGQHNRIVFYKAPGGKLSEQDWADVTTFVVDQALNDKW